MSIGLRFLRPYLYPCFRPASIITSSAHLRFYNASQQKSDKQSNDAGQLKAVDVHQRIHEHFSSASYQQPETQNDATPRQKSAGIQRRARELSATGNLRYPRIKVQDGSVGCRTFVEHYDSLNPNESRDGEEVSINGRILSFRVAGPKLVFIDIFQQECRVQGLCDFERISHAGVPLEDFKQFYHSLQRGDIFSFKGIPHRTKRGQLSLLVTEVPQLLSPCLHSLPTDLQDKETRIRNRHVDFLVNPQSAETLRLRSEIIRFMRQFLLDEAHTEVQTPILAAAAGGAVAKPFQTSAVEFQDRQIALRVAPELWLKRLILGGFDRVFEIGPSFRNEGLDMNHNPEFTTCEFYRAFADLEELIGVTERMFSGLARHAKSLSQKVYKNIEPSELTFNVPFARIDFVPALESAMKCTLPDLQSPDVETKIIQIMKNYNICPPAGPSLPRLLDKLSSIYLEPQCADPTFIVNHPECLSPLSKSYLDPITNQRISARAELFINGQEIVNTYEEENSPFEQRRKFVQQLQWRNEGEPSTIDENYIEALEWGLPPTGGWGCGIDRLCMLLSGSRRIGDVLAFGTLRNVVALGRGNS